MISTEHVRLMARYNSWQNRSLYEAASTLTDVERRADRGAFFGSIQHTLSHLAWGDQMWMSRFSGRPHPQGGIKDSPTLYPDWLELAAVRRELDAELEAWAAGLAPDWLAGDLVWHSGATGMTMTRPRWILVTHLFNHQTHHRGQVHALLTSFGARPEDTDLMLLPAA